MPDNPNIQKLHEFLTAKGLTAKSYEDFTQSMSDTQNVIKLHGFMSAKGMTAKSVDDFSTLFAITAPEMGVETLGAEPVAEEEVNFADRIRIPIAGVPTGGVDITDTWVGNALQRGMNLVNATRPGVNLALDLSAMQGANEMLELIAARPDDEIIGEGKTAADWREEVLAKKAELMPRALASYKKANKALTAQTSMTAPETAEEAFESVENFAHFAVHSIGQMIPMMVASLGTAGLGTFAMETGMVQMDMIQKILDDPNNTLTVEEIFEQSLVDPKWAVRAGLAAGALDVVSLGIMAKASGLTAIGDKLISQAAKDMAEEAAKKATKTVAGKVAVATATSASAEALTEGTQGQIEQYGAAKGSGTEFKWDWGQFFTEALAGGIGSGFFGGGGAYLQSKLQGNPKKVQKENEAFEESVKKVLEDAKGIDPKVLEEKALKYDAANREMLAKAWVEEQAAAEIDAIAEEVPSPEQGWQQEIDKMKEAADEYADQLAERMGVEEDEGLARELEKELKATEKAQTKLGKKADKKVERGLTTAEEAAERAEAREEEKGLKLEEKKEEGLLGFIKRDRETKEEEKKSEKKKEAKEITTSRVPTEKGELGIFWGTDVGSIYKDKSKVKQQKLPTEGDNVANFELTKKSGYGVHQGTIKGTPVSDAIIQGDLVLDSDVQDNHDIGAAITLKRKGIEIAHFYNKKSPNKVTSLDLRNISLEELENKYNEYKKVGFKVLTQEERAQELRAQEEKIKERDEAQKPKEKPVEQAPAEVKETVVEGEVVQETEAEQVVSETAFKTKMPNPSDYIEEGTLNTKKYYNAASEAMGKDTQTEQVEVADPDGNKVPVDKVLAPFMKRLWKLGLISLQSDSGAQQDHADKTGSRSDNGYIAFAAKGADEVGYTSKLKTTTTALVNRTNSDEIIQAIKDAARNAGMKWKSTETFFAPSTTVQMPSGLTDAQIVQMWKNFTTELEARLSEKEVVEEKAVSTKYEGGAVQDNRSIADEERSYDDLSIYLKKKYAKDEYKGHQHHEAAVKELAAIEEFKELKLETGWQKLTETTKINLTTGEIAEVKGNKVTSRKATPSEIEKAPKKKEKVVVDTKKEDKEAKNIRLNKSINTITERKSDGNTLKNERPARALDRLQKIIDDNPDDKQITERAQKEINRIEEDRAQKESQRTRKEEEARVRKEEAPARLAAEKKEKAEKQAKYDKRNKLELAKRALQNEVLAGKDRDEAIADYQARRKEIGYENDASEDALSSLLAKVDETLKKRKDTKKSKLVSKALEFFSKDDEKRAAAKKAQDKEDKDFSEKAKIREQRGKSTRIAPAKKEKVGARTEIEKENAILRKLEQGIKLTESEERAWRLALIQKDREATAKAKKEELAKKWEKEEKEAEKKEKPKKVKLTKQQKKEAKEADRKLKEERAEQIKKEKATKKEAEEAAKKLEADGVVDLLKPVTIHDILNQDEDDGASYDITYKLSPATENKKQLLKELHEEMSPGERLFLDGEVSDLTSGNFIKNIRRALKDNKRSLRLWQVIGDLVVTTNRALVKLGKQPIKIIYADSVFYESRHYKFTKANDMAGLYASTSKKGGTPYIVLNGAFGTDVALFTSIHEFLHPYFNLMLGAIADSSKNVKHSAIKKYHNRIFDLYLASIETIEEYRKEYLKGNYGYTPETALPGFVEAMIDYLNVEGGDQKETAFDIYGMTDIGEFISELSNHNFIRVLNSIQGFQAKGKLTKESIFTRIVEAIADLLENFNLKINKASVLHDVLRQLAKAEKKIEKLTKEGKIIHKEWLGTHARLVEGEAVLGDGFYGKIKGKKSRANALWAIIKDSPMLTSKEKAKELVEMINEKLPEKYKLDETEINSVLEKYRTEKIDDRKEALMDSITKLSEVSKETTGRGAERVSKISKAVRGILEEINRRITMEHTPESDKRAEDRLNQLINKQNNLLTEMTDDKEDIINGITEEEQSELDYLRFELAHQSSLSELRLLKADLQSILKAGRSERRMKVQQRAEDRRKIRQKTLQYLTGTEEGAIPEEGTPEFDKLAAEKNRTWVQRQLAGAKKRYHKERVKFSSWPSLMNILSRNDMESDADSSFFHQMFAVPERKANIAKTAAIAQQNKKMSDKIFDIFLKDEISDHVLFGTREKKLEQAKRRNEGLKDTPLFLSRMINAWTDKLNKEVHKIAYFVEEGHSRAGEKLAPKYSADQLMSIWLWLQDEALESNFVKNGYGADFKNAVNEWMDENPKYKELANWMVEEFMPEMYERINGRYKERNDMDLEFIRRYFPHYFDQSSITDKGDAEGVSLIEDHPVASVNRRNTMSRHPNNHKLNFKMGLMNVAQRHINNSEHYIAYDQLVSDLRSVFGNSDIQKTIAEYYSPEINTAARFFIDRFATENVMENLGSHYMDWMRKVMYPIFLGVNPVVYLKQATSAVAYSVHMPKGSAKSWAEMQAAALVRGSKDAEDKKDAIKHISNMPMMQKRARKGTRSLSEAQISPARLFGERVGNPSISDMAMFLVKKGDLAAIIQGGWPVYQASYETALAGGMSEKGARSFAEFKFIDTTLQTQQSTETADMSEFQLSRNVYMRFAASFVTTPMQYARRFNSAARTFNRARKRGDKAVMKRSAAQMAMYGVMLPMIFEAVAQGFAMATTDDEDERKALLARLMYAPISSYLMGAGIMTQIIEASIMRGMFTGEYFGGYKALYSTLFDEVRKAGKASWEGVTEGEMPSDKEIEAILNVTGAFLGRIPAGNIYGLGTGMVKAATGEGDIRGAIGYSDWGLGKGAKPGGLLGRMLGGETKKRRKPAKRASGKRESGRR